MSINQATPGFQLRPVRAWRASGRALAAGAAAGGDPAPLLVLEAHERHARPARQPDLIAARRRRFAR